MRVRIIQYPLVLEHDNYRYTYEWQCPRDGDTEVLEASEEEPVCGTCGFLATPKLASKVKINPDIPDPEDDIPF